MNYQKIISFIYKQMKPYKMKLISIFICMLIITFLGFVSPLLGQQLFDLGIIPQDMTKVLHYTVLIIVIGLLNIIFSFIQFIQYEKINKLIPYKLIYNTFNHCLKLKISYFKDNNFSKIIYNTHFDISNITQIINANILNSIVSLFKVLGGAIGLYIINWKLTLFVLLIAPIQLFLTIWFSNIRQKAFIKVMQSNETFSNWFSETLCAMETIKLWNLQSHKKKRFVELQRDLIQKEIKTDYIDNFSFVGNSLLDLFFNNTLILLGALLIFRNQLSIGGLFAFCAYASQIIQSITILSYVVYNLSGSLASFERYMQFFDNESEPVYVGIKSPQELSTADDVDTIEFRDVCLSYLEEKPILKKMNFTIHKGEKIALVGRNGAGKTSIINLLLRFYQPDAGAIYINGINIEQLNLKAYRNLFSVMNQTVFMFNESIRKNIDLYDAMDEIELYECAKTAELSNFLSTMPKGLDTVIGYNGTKLSGGEKQKIALCRTLAKQGKILILDEATANFDFSSEYLFNQYLKSTNLFDMVIIITHKPELLKHIDKIFVLHEGDIVETGTYDSLCRQSSYFNQIFIEGEAIGEYCN